MTVCMYAGVKQVFVCIGDRVCVCGGRMSVAASGR